MCNLYRMKASADEMAALFRVTNSAGGGNYADEVYPGYPGLVVADGALRQMTWGFPLARVSKVTGKPLKPKPVNNTRADKLDSFFWRYSFQERRCLIPLTAWAEAEGPRGGKTRTWLNLPDQTIFACAGIWRTSDEWGDVYSMVMTDACGTAAECHSRMPVIIQPNDWTRWQSTSPAKAQAICVPYEGAVRIDRTREPWTS